MAYIQAGRKAINVLRLANDVADGETVTIGNDVYEFDTAATASLLVPSRIRVDVSGGVTPTLAATALVAAINANGREAVQATKISANEVLIMSQNADAIVLSCSETLAGVSNQWAASAMYGGLKPGQKRISIQSRVPNATEVALKTMHFGFNFTPSDVAVQVFVTGTPPLAFDYDGTVTISGGRVSLASATVDFAATHTVRVIAWE